jgi:hypothetical protein
LDLIPNIIVRSSAHDDNVSSVVADGAEVGFFLAPHFDGVYRESGEAGRWVLFCQWDGSSWQDHRSLWKVVLGGE